jgi:hypothetical protein
MVQWVCITGAGDGDGGTELHIESQSGAANGMEFSRVVCQRGDQWHTVQTLTPEARRRMKKCRMCLRAQRATGGE